MTTTGGGDTPADEVSPVEIEREIERTRERMGVHLEELGEKLSPDHLKQHAKEVIAGKAQKTGARLYEFARRHPVPVAAAGLGAVLLAVRNGRRRGAASGHTLAFAFVAGVVGVALGIMAPDA